MRYSKEQKNKVFDRVEEILSRGESLRSALSNYSGMPDQKTFFIWLKIKDNHSEEETQWKEEKRKQYARAMKAREDFIFEEILEIADSSEDNYQDENGNIRIDGAAIQKKRVQIDSRKWMLGKMRPKKYGDSTMLKHADPDGQPVKMNAIFSTDIMNVPTDDGVKEDS